MNGGHSDFYSFESMYSGQPENNVLWVNAGQIFGECWIGKKVKDINKIGTKYEFVRGNIPKAHQYGPTKRDKRAAHKKQMEKPILVGRYKGKSFKYIYDTDPSYYYWCVDKGIAPRDIE
jgi:hypothetical protein